MRTFWLTAGLGLLAGMLIAWLTLLLSATDIGGPGWSLGGNGALIVEFSAGPAVLAGGWVGVSRARRDGVLAGLLTLVLAAGFTFSPVLVGAVLGPLLGCLAGLLLARPRLLTEMLPAAVVAVAAALLLLAPTGLTFVLGPVVLPLLVAWPSLKPSAWPSLIAVPATLLVGLFLGQRL